MSLKAKLEAVIYAAEEPVPLAQLAMLFGNEALEWKAEKEAARSAEAAAELPLEPGADAAEGEPAPEDLQVEAPAMAAEDGAESAEVNAPAAEAELAEIPTETGQDSAAAEAEARRVARQRDREVRNILREILDEIIASYVADDRGVEIREIAGGYRMATKPECHDAVRMFVKSLKPALKLSLPALETLAVVAYKQPITAPEVNEIRGVDSSGVFGSLLARKLISTAGRKQVIGRPILYKTTKEFLLRFGLKDISELPSMEEFEKMAASELEEVETAAPKAADTPASETPATESDAPTAEIESPSEVTDAPTAETESPSEVTEAPTAEAESPIPEAEDAVSIEDDALEAAKAIGDETQSPDTSSEPQASTQSPEPQSESNPSETAPVNAESGAE